MTNQRDERTGEEVWKILHDCVETYSPTKGHEKKNLTRAVAREKLLALISQARKEGREEGKKLMFDVIAQSVSSDRIDHILGIIDKSSRSYDLYCDMLDTGSAYRAASNPPTTGGMHKHDFVFRAENGNTCLCGMTGEEFENEKKNRPAATDVCGCGNAHDPKYACTVPTQPLCETCRREKCNYLKHAGCQDCSALCHKDVFNKCGHPNEPSPEGV